MPVFEHHWHVCGEPGCFHIWAHAGSDIPSGQLCQGVSYHLAAHTCPRCDVGRDFWASDTLRDALDRQAQHRIRRYGYEHPLTAKWICDMDRACDSEDSLRQLIAAFMSMATGRNRKRNQA